MSKYNVSDDLFTSITEAVRLNRPFVISGSEPNTMHISIYDWRTYSYANSNNTGISFDVDLDKGLIKDINRKWIPCKKKVLDFLKNGCEGKYNLHIIFKESIGEKHWYWVTEKFAHYTAKSWTDVPYVKSIAINNSTNAV